MADSTQVRVHVERKGHARNVQIDVGGRPYQLNQGVANVPLEAGKGYWLYWSFEGRRGASIAIVVKHGEEKLLEFPHDKTELPDQLRRNAGTLYFKVPA